MSIEICYIFTSFSILNPDLSTDKQSNESEYIYNPQIKRETLNEKKIKRHDNQALGSMLQKSPLLVVESSPARTISHNNQYVVDETGLGENIVMQGTVDHKHTSIFDETILAGTLVTNTGMNDSSFASSTICKSSNLGATSTPLKLTCPSQRILSTNREDIDVHAVPIYDLQNQEMVSAVVNINGQLKICAVPKQFAHEDIKHKDDVNDSVIDSKEHILRVIDVDEAGNLITEPVLNCAGVKEVAELQDVNIRHNDIRNVVAEPNNTERLFEVPYTDLAYVYSAQTETVTKVKLDCNGKDTDIGTYLPITKSLEVNAETNVQNKTSAKSSSEPHSLRKFSKKRIKECYAIVRHQQLERKRNKMFNSNASTQIYGNNQTYSLKQKYPNVHNVNSKLRSTKRKSIDGKRKTYRKTNKSTYDNARKRDPDFKPSMYIRPTGSTLPSILLYNEHLCKLWTSKWYYFLLIHGFPLDLPKRASKRKGIINRYHQNNIPSDILDWMLEGTVPDSQPLITNFFKNTSIPNPKKMVQKSITQFFMTKDLPQEKNNISSALQLSTDLPDSSNQVPFDNNRFRKLIY